MATRTMSRKQNLVTASREWATRPADQRFWTLKELYERSLKYAEESYTHQVRLADCSVLATEKEDLVLDMANVDTPATFQHYSFNQLAGLAGAPAGYLRGLPAPIAALNLNHGLQQIDGSQLLMLHKNGGHALRCVTSDGYSRIWNYEVAEMALALEEEGGWVVPPARPTSLPDVPVRKATEADVLRKGSHLSLGIGVGDDISPAGLYASDHDCFIFQVNVDRPIDAGNGEMLYRGVFWRNSEVGDARFTGTMFLFDTVCGNHIVWGARIVAEISIIHRGNAQEMFREAMAQATVMMEAPSSDDENRIKAAKLYEIAPTSKETIETIYRKSVGLSKRECEDAYILATRHAEDHGTEPNTAWGYAAGITRLSQGQTATDKRDLMDRAAGKVLEMAIVRR